jgi:hypothetical protein
MKLATASWCRNLYRGHGKMYGEADKLYVCHHSYCPLNGV